MYKFLYQKCTFFLISENEFSHALNIFSDVIFLSFRPLGTRQRTAFTACYTKKEHLGEHQIVRYDHVITNVGNGYSSSDGHFTAAVDGVYTFSLTGMAETTSAGVLNIMKNGEFVVKSYSNKGEYDSSSVTIHLQLNSSDAVWVENGSGVRQLTYGGDNCFSGILEK